MERRSRRGGRVAALCLVGAVLATGCAEGGAAAAGDHKSRSAAESAPAVRKVRKVKLKVVRQGGRTLVFVPVSVSGHGPLLFALDTGAATSVVDKDVARALHLRATGRRASVSGVAGSATVPLVRVPRWKLGGITLSAATIASVDFPGNPTTGGGLQGLLGSDVLSRFDRVSIDYRHQTLELPTAGSTSSPREP